MDKEMKEFMKKNLKDTYHDRYIKLANEVQGNRMSRKKLVKAFKKVIPRREYIKKESLELLSLLEIITNSNIKKNKPHEKQ
jgi:hypothetical protein